MEDKETLCRTHRGPLRSEYWNKREFKEKILNEHI